jgi:hypothetical protein
MQPWVLALLAFGAGALGGITSSVAVRDARADALGEVTVPVPTPGVVFRSSDGRPIARIRSGAAGGSFEILDSRGVLAVRLRATAAGGVVELGPSPSSSAPPRAVVKLAGSSEDPGY